MQHNRLRLALALGALGLSSPALAGPAHVLASHVLAAAPAGATYAISPDLDRGTRRALDEAFQEAGLETVPADRPHTYIVSVQARASVLCTAACSPLLGHDVGPLADNYRHLAVVAAQPNTGTRLNADEPVAWYTYLQSDGLSSRTSDYLPSLLRYGARAYGRNTTPEKPPKLSAPTPFLPNVHSYPGA